MTAGGLSTQHIPYNELPIRIDNDDFEGHVIIIVKPDDRGDYRYASYFEGKKRRIELQVQGRFKRPPTEMPMIRVSPKPLLKMSLNLVTRSACGIILAVLRRVLGADSFSHSFGSADEPPHMTFPFSVMCSIHCTPEGEKPPALASDVLRRLKSTDADWAKALPLDTRTTYTFTWYSMYLDIVTWEVVSVPGLRSFSLSSFWGSADSMQLHIFRRMEGKTPVGTLWNLRLAKGLTGAELLNDREAELGGYRSRSSSDASFVTAESGVSDDWHPVSLDGPAAAPERRGGRIKTCLVFCCISGIFGKVWSYFQRSGRSDRYAGLQSSYGPPQAGDEHPDESSWTMLPLPTTTALHLDTKGTFF
eukprot:TRINITY_DN12585_c0_g1_i8.p1 TRINITY_DN12585_c0_g1~~TRINITY_DN12585_c0_g1_i8.p1  ORF type:complete len:361 (+),score=50.05 TRINITY_DN12585_c0_g1_i8:139-1221(+)